MSSTPPRATLPDGFALLSITDTPSKSKQAVSAPVLLKDKTGDSREAVVDDVGAAVPQVELKWFKDNILPPLPANLNLSDVMKKLEAKKEVISGGVLTDFKVAPADARGHEDDVFSPFASIAAHAAAAAKELTHIEPTVRFECNPSQTPKSLRRNNKTRPDGYGRYTAHWSHNQQTKHVFWAEIVAPGEFKKVKNAENTNDNIAKILWSFHHIMREDPCRRFVVGFTIENKDMRLWYGSRTDALVTEAFDFTRDYETLAHFFLSQMYAKDYELGYDPTIQPAKDASKFKNQYDITVHYAASGTTVSTADRIDVSKLQTVVIRTTELESEIGAEAMRSRGTRVWRGRMLNGPHKGRQMVIKDYWVDHDRLREAEIYSKILKDAPTEADETILKKHLLTPVYYGDVVINNQRDNTLSLLRRGAVVPTGVVYPTIHSDVGDTRSDVLEERPGAPRGTGTILAPPHKAPRPVLFHEKSHHRVVFLECAVTIDRLDSVHTVLVIAAQAITVLNVLHACGWVHRDISAGNILVVESVVKIADLEYAKRMDSTITHEHGRSPGTPMFQAIEAASHMYIFTFQVRRPGQDREELDSDTSLHLFRYNPLHDLESIWWLLVWLLLVRKINVEGDTDERRYNQFEFYHRFYSADREIRRNFFMLPALSQQGAAYLHDALSPAGKLLNWMRNDLLYTYMNAEHDVTKIDHRVGAVVAKQIISDIEKVARDYEGERDVPFFKDLKYRRKCTPEQPGAAVAIGTSLDFHVGDGSKKRDYHAMDASAVVDGEMLWKAVDDVKVKRARQEETDKAKADTQRDDVGAVGKGKAKAVEE